MSNFRERVCSSVRAEFINAISDGDYDIIHNVKVHEKICESGTIDYNDESEEINIKGARLTKKKDEHGGFKYWLKITVES